MTTAQMIRQGVIVHQQRDRLSDSNKNVEWHGQLKKTVLFETLSAEKCLSDIESVWFLF